MEWTYPTGLKLAFLMPSLQGGTLFQVNVRNPLVLSTRLEQIVKQTNSSHGSHMADSGCSTWFLAESMGCLLVMPALSSHRHLLWYARRCCDVAGVGSSKETAVQVRSGTPAAT